jgi:hypothetical protein
MNIVSINLSIPDWVPEELRNEIAREMKEQAREAMVCVWLRYSPKVEQPE